METKNKLETTGTNDDASIMGSKENILLIQLFSNGDCLFATTIAKQIKNDYPQCRLTWAVSSKCKSILINNPHVDSIFEVDIPDPSQNLSLFEKTVNEANEKLKNGVYTHVFVTQLLGDNMAYYDGVVCSSILRNYGKPVTVDTTPVLYLTDEEIENANAFALVHKLQNYEHVVLFECAPQTNQIKLTDEIILEYALQILKQKNTCVILSAPKAYSFNNPHIINGNSLSIRETVALTHYCTIILGCSSGISWAATSTAAKHLPMVQILAEDAYYFNPLSLTFKKLGKSTDQLLELLQFNGNMLGNVFSDIFNLGFDHARIKHAQVIKKQFRLHRGIIYNFLKKKKFSSVAKFITINFKENGLNLSMIKYLLLGFVLFPFQYLNDINKKI